MGRARGTTNQRLIFYSYHWYHHMWKCENVQWPLQNAVETKFNLASAINLHTAVYSYILQFIFRGCIFGPQHKHDKSRLANAKDQLPYGISRQNKHELQSHRVALAKCQWACNNYLTKRRQVPIHPLYKCIKSYPSYVVSSGSSACSTSPVPRMINSEIIFFAHFICFWSRGSARAKSEC